MVCLHTVHALGSAADSTEDIPAADHDTYLHTFFNYGLDFFCVFCDALGINTKIFLPHQGFSAEFEEHSIVFHLFWFEHKYIESRPLYATRIARVFPVLSTKKTRRQCRRVS